jgi:signal transduction histidine kinase
MQVTVLISFDAPTAEAVHRAIDVRIDAEQYVIETTSETVRVAIEEVRKQYGAAPVGVAARSASEALAAIEHGADDALVVTAESPAHVFHELVDRTRLRGALRASGEQLKMSLAHADKLASLGTLVAGVAHEINNPLNALVMHLEVFPMQIKAAAEAIGEILEARESGIGIGADDVRRVAASAELFGAKEEILEQIDDMVRVVGAIRSVASDLRVLARNDDKEPAQVVNLRQLVHEVARIAGRDIFSNGVLEIDVSAELPEVLVPRSRLAQVLMNVLVNAVHAIREVQRPMHRIRVTARADAEAIAVSIADTGPGIAPDAIERIFDPFYTTKRAGAGTGLGLSISRTLMQKMGGDLIVESVYGAGATFIAIIPRASPAEIAAAKRKSSIPHMLRVVPASRVSVLVVDEDDHLLRAYSRVLSKHFDVLLANDAQEAIDLITSGSRADVVLTDVALPPFEGAHFLHWLRDNQPTLAARTVFVASERDSQRELQLLGDAARLVLPKPTPTRALVEAIETAARR